MGEKIITRAEVSKENTWAIEDLYANETLWEEDCKRVDCYCEKIKEKKADLFSNGKTLKEFLDLYQEAGLVLERLYVYAHQKYHEDTTNSKYQELSERASMEMMKYNSTVSFFQPAVLALEEKKFWEIFVECKEILSKEEASGYERFFKEIMRQKEHSLSEELEEILANGKEVFQAPGNIFSMFNNADITFSSVTDEDGKKAELTHGRYIHFLQSKDRKVRKEAFQNMYEQYQAFQNTLASTYAANVKKNVFLSKTRKYSSSLAMALDQSEVPEAVYHNLIQVVREHLPLMHRYMKLRKKALGVEELHMYDVYVPIVEESTEKIDYEQAKEMVSAGLKPMGTQYGEILQEGFQNRWIDIYENKGKRSGAYSWGTYSVHPYVLLNHQNNLNSVFTLAHEMGHAIHSYYSNKNQPYICAGYEIFVAEVASTCNEALLIHDLLEKTTDKKKRAYLLNYYLEQFRTTLFRQTLFAEFEWKVHEKAEKGEALTAQSLCEIYHKLNEDYFGTDTVIDTEIDMEWARIPHFYTSFYVYQYATGYSAAIALSKKILKEGESAVKDYIEKFLSGGSSKSPIDLLKGAGVDMSKKQPIEAAMEVFKELLDEIEKLV